MWVVSGFRSLTMMQRTLATLCDRIMLNTSAASSPSSIIRAVDEEFLDIGHGAAEICDERPSPVLLLSCSLGLRHSRSAVPPTSSASSTTGGHPLLIRSHRCSPEE